MIGALAHVHDALVAQRRAGTVATQHAAILRALASAGGRMLTRRTLRRLVPDIDAHDLQCRLNVLERTGRIVVDREERPVLYGVLP